MATKSVTQGRTPAEKLKIANKQQPGKIQVVNGGNHECWKIDGYGKIATGHKGGSNKPAPPHIERNLNKWLLGAGFFALAFGCGITALTTLFVG